jgi:hypothetical protein
MTIAYCKVRFSLTVIAICGLVGCATEKVTRQQAFDFSKMGRIELKVSGTESAVVPDNVAQQVSQNLLGWHYPMGAEENKTYSHTLTATVAAVEHGSTPTGFSFSSGNSDPRAMDFQKTDILPIVCRLTSIDHPEQTGELKMGFSADQISRNFLHPDKLADHISTVCFNLLSQLKWPLDTKQTADEKIIPSPSWMPEIRIETKQPEASVAPEAKAAPINKANDQTIDKRPSTNADSEGRKQIIIYNQGSPVTLELGHHRR